MKTSEEEATLFFCETGENANNSGNIQIEFLREIKDKRRKFRKDLLRKQHQISFPFLLTEILCDHLSNPLEQNAAQRREKIHVSFEK